MRTATHERTSRHGGMPTMMPAMEMSFDQFGADPDEDVSPSVPESPERRLLLAVLLDAIVCVQRIASTPPGQRRRELEESKRWIRSDDCTWPYSFVNVCEALGLAHQPIRRALVEGRLLRLECTDREARIARRARSR
jgi:hypothetical protein